MSVAQVWHKTSLPFFLGSKLPSGLSHPSLKMPLLYALFQPTSLDIPLSQTTLSLQIACIGVILGPMYPIFVDHGAQILPTYLFTACMGWISGIGMTGSAALPFVTGILAAKYDIESLQPL